MKNKYILVIASFLVLVNISFSILKKEKTTLTFSYISNYEGDTKVKQHTGLMWALSYLGAELPKGVLNKNITWNDSSTYTICFDDLGFRPQALVALKSIIDSIKNTHYYKEQKKIDPGQFIALTIGSSWHYYAITLAEKDFNSYQKKYNLANHSVFLINHSTVAKGNRVVKFITSKSVLKSAFIAEEFENEFSENSLPAYFETVDVMKNGQLRFAVYNAEGSLAAASPKHLGEAGKPGKCMWCHEIIFQPLFAPTDSFQNSITPLAFQTIIKQENQKLTTYRKTLKSDIDFSKTQDHTLMELLYISYYEPSYKKIAIEWGLTLQEIKALIQTKNLHKHEEFSYLNELVYRDSVLLNKNYNNIPVPKSVREPNNFEPYFYTR